MGTEFTYRGSGQTERATLSAPCELPPCTTHFLDTALGLSGERSGSKHAVYAGATSSAYAELAITKTAQR